MQPIRRRKEGELNISRPHVTEASLNLGLEEQLAELRTTIEAQSTRIAVLEAERDAAVHIVAHAGLGPADSEPGLSHMSRARMLKAAAAVAAGVVAVGAGSKSNAFAAGGARSVFGKPNRTANGARRATADANFAAYGTDTTYTPDTTVGFDASDTSSGLQTGVYGYGTNTGTHGKTSSGSGFGILGENDNTQKTGKGLFGGVAGTAVNGYGVLGFVEGGAGVFGGSFTTGAGVMGASEKGTGIHATSYGKSASAFIADQAHGGDAIQATSKFSRGAVLSGGKAALQLTPTKTNSHPLGGQPGDMMVDRFHRLWFCQRGGSPATWKLIA
jgi:hypothetical protein